MTDNHKNQTMQRASDAAKSVHLSASAGSGKTRALKERYLALLERLDMNGLGIDQAVAITFTDKAAAEIKERVMQDIPETMLKKIIRGRQDLRISTIHSFCMNLLKRYPLEAGLPPDFGVLDERDQAYKIQKAVEDALEESDRHQEIMAPLRDFTADDLIETIAFLISIRSRLKRMEIDSGGLEGLLRSVGLGMGTEQAETEMKRLIESPDWRALFMQMELLFKTQGDQYEECRGQEHASLAAAKDVHAAYRTAESLKPVYFTQKAEPRKKPPISRTKFNVSKTFRYPAYEMLYSQVQDALSRFLSAYRRAQAGYETTGLLKLFNRAEEKYQESKLREGLLDFDDLEICAYSLLRSAESPDILYWLDRKLLHFLVDEFQDTSDIQWAILNKLTEEIFSGRGADKPMPPTIFVVGDAKQSIYRFREANYRLIENVRKKMEENILPESREIRTLDRNFRSTPEIIAAVNEVFKTLWGEAYQQSETDRKQHKGSVRLIELLPASSKEESSGPTEAEILAREIKNVVLNKNIIYEKDIDAWKARPAGYGDCAALIQSRTKLKEYEAALQKEGVPFRVVGGIGFYEEDEIQAVMNVLFFLWNRGDKLSLAAALKSPLFGLTDGDIMEVFSGSEDALNTLKNRRPGAWALLKEWGRMAGVEPLAGLIHRIIQDSGAYIRFGRRNPQAIFNIDKLLDTAREFDRRGYTTLQDFVERVKNIRAAEQREAAADMNLPGFQGAMSIMTVHKAKGLEFPIVFLPGMNQKTRSVSDGPRAIIESDGRMRMAAADKGSPVYNEMWEREKEELRREHQRLLYVAMTRARDHLIMIGELAGVKSEAKQNTWLNYLYETIPPPRQRDENAGPSVIVRSYPDWNAQMIPADRYAGQPADRQIPKQEEIVDGNAVIRNISRIPMSEVPEWKKATDFIRDREREESLDRLLPEAGIKTLSPLVRGSILHRCLESLTIYGAYNLEQITKEFPESEPLEKEAREKFLKDAEAALRSVIDNKDLAWIFERGPDSYSELPFLYKRGRDLVSGAIDRVIIKNDKGFVIDYKAILIENDADLALWKEHYLPQIKIYCEAVKEIFKIESVEGYLLFLDSGRLELTAVT